MGYASDHAPATQLEDWARRCAAEAIRLDSQGARGMAIQMYQRAISTLIKLARLHPHYELNKLYLERARRYQERVTALQKVYEKGEAAEQVSVSTPQQEPGQRVEEKPPGMVESLKATYEDLILLEKPQVGWEDVVGLEDAKKGVRESIVFPSKRPDLFPLGWPQGVLLYGPPGCGKTLLAAASAAEIEGVFITIDAASIMSKWLGEAEKNVAKLFNSARKMLSNDGTSIIIFIDELDSLLGMRSNEVGGEVRVRNQFLKEMDGVADKGRDQRLYVIGATNKPWALDWPFLRRFQKRIYVPLPDLSTRTEMLKLYARPLKLAPDIKWEALAKMMEGYSGSDIRDICQGVQLRVVSELFESGRASDESLQPREITSEDFKEVLKSRRPSVSSEMLIAYHKWSENFQAL